MGDAFDLVAALRQPLQMVLDAGERIWWPFLLASVFSALLLLGVRRGLLELRRGLFSRRVWAHPSSRTDIGLLFAKALVAGVLRIAWLSLTFAFAIEAALVLERWLGTPRELGWHPGVVAVAYTIVLFVVWDCSRFVLHWAMHAVPVLWSFHQVHHSAEVLTPLTLYRTHPVESLLFELRGVATTGLVAGVFLYVFRGSATELQLAGINAIGFAFNAAGANLRHSHVWLRFGRFERWLLSPAQHQVHHGREIEQQQSNYGTWLALWDRMIGTWRPSPPQAITRFGLDHANHRADSVTSALVGPLRDAASLVADGVRRRSWSVATVLALVAAPRSARAAAPVRSAPPPQAVLAPEGVEVPTPQPARGTASVREASPVPKRAAPPAAVSVPPPTIALPPRPEPVTDDEAMQRTVVVGSMFDGAALPRVAGSAHVIGPRELERREHDDIHRVLAAVPGVYVRGEDGYGLRPNIGLRGANPDRSSKVTLMEDSVLMAPAPYSAPAAYYFPLPTRMYAIEVFKGPAAIRHGPNTIGGAVNLLSRPIPAANAMVLDIAGGRFGYAKGHGFWGTTYKGFGVLIEAAHVQSSGFKRLDSGGDTGFGKNDAMVKLGYETRAGPRARRHRVELKLGFANEKSNETYLGLTAADFAETPYRRYSASARDRMKWWRSQAELAYVAGDETLELDTRLYRHDFHRVWRRLDHFRDGTDLGTVLANPDAGQLGVLAAVLRGEEDASAPEQALMVTRNDRRFVSQGVQSVLHWRPHWRWFAQDLEIGIRVHNDSIVRDHTEDAYLMTSGVLVPEGTPTMQALRNRGETNAAAFHIHDAITLWDRLTVAPGARVELIQMRYVDDLSGEAAERLDLAIAPGLGALVVALPWLGMFAGVHRGFSPVAPGQALSVRPERAVNYEAGLRAVHRGLHAEAVGFFSDYANLNGVCTFSSGCADADGMQQFSAGRVWVYGLESLARYRHRFRSGFALEVGALYTFTFSQFRRDFQSAFTQWGDVSAGDELPYLPKHLVGGTFGVGGRTWDVSVVPAYTGAMRDVAGSGPIPSEDRIDGFFVLDLSAEVRVLRRVVIYGQMGNVTNNAYIASRRPYGIRPGAPLTFMLGIKVHVLP